MTNNRTEDDIRRRALIADMAKKLWLEHKPVKDIEKATGATYALFKQCIIDKESNFFELHERKRGRKYSYRDRLEPEELTQAVRMYLLKEKKLPQICSQFKVAPYLLRRLLKEAGVWRSQPGKERIVDRNKRYEEEIASGLREAPKEYKSDATIVPVKIVPTVKNAEEIEHE